MNWLSMLTENDKREIVAELATRLAASPELITRWEAATERVLARHGFRAPVSDTSIVHNVTASQIERDGHTRRMLALSSLIAEAKAGVTCLREGDNGGRDRLAVKLDIAIAAVEREFKP